MRHSARKKVTLRMGRKKVKQMKKLMTFVAVLSMTSIAWAGSGREATADRLEHADRVSVANCRKTTGAVSSHCGGAIDVADRAV